MVLFALSALVAVGTAAVEAPPEPEELELTPRVRSELALLQEVWLDWLTAVYEVDTAATELALAELQAGADRVGLQRLPDLSLGAAAYSVRMAVSDVPERAELALQAAERLDPGLAEPEFARALVNRRRGGTSMTPLAAIRHLAGSPLLSRIGLANLTIWLLGTLLLAGMAFVAIEMATRGRRLVARLFGWMRRYLPETACYLFTLVLLLWPVALPSGPVLLVVYWAVLLWGHGGRIERVALAALLLLLGVTPLLVNEQRKALGVALSAPVLAMEDVESGRLTGTLFSDLGVLRAILPDSIPVKQLLADVHGMLGQWPQARELYLEVIDAEPENPSVLVDAGVCFFQQGDFDRAIELFRQAASLPPGSAAAHYNLSQTHSELLDFEESARALRVAQSLAPQEVGRWIREAAESRVVAVYGGLARAAEIRRQVAAAWRSGEVTPSWYLSLPLAVMFVAIAVALHLLLRRAGRRAVRPGESEERLTLTRWGRTLLPGYAEADARLWGRALISLLAPAALLSLPLAGQAGFRMPWLLATPGRISWWIAAVGLLLWLAGRYWRQGRAS